MHMSLRCRCLGSFLATLELYHLQFVNSLDEYHPLGPKENQAYCVHSHIPQFEIEAPHMEMKACPYD